MAWRKDGAWCAHVNIKMYYFICKMRFSRLCGIVRCKCSRMKFVLCLSAFQKVEPMIQSTLCSVNQFCICLCALLNPITTLLSWQHYFTSLLPSKGNKRGATLSGYSCRNALQLAVLEDKEDDVNVWNQILFKIFIIFYFHISVMFLTLALV